MKIGKRQLDQLTLAIHDGLDELIAESDCWPNEKLCVMAILNLYNAAKDAGINVRGYGVDIRRVAGRNK